MRLETGMLVFERGFRPASVLIHVGAWLRSAARLFRWVPNHVGIVVRLGDVPHVFHATHERGCHFVTWAGFVATRPEKSVRVVPLEAWGVRGDILKFAQELEGIPYERLLGMAGIPFDRNPNEGTGRLFCSELVALLLHKCLATVAAQRAQGLRHPWMASVEAEFGFVRKLRPAQTEPDELWVPARKLRGWLKAGDLEA